MRSAVACAILASFVCPIPVCARCSSSVIPIEAAVSVCGDLSVSEYLPSGASAVLSVLSAIGASCSTVAVSVAKFTDATLTPAVFFNVFVTVAAHDAQVMP